MSVNATTPTLYDVNCTGRQAFNAPHWTVNAGLQHTIPIGDNNLVLSANTQYRGSRYTSFEYIAAEHLGGTTQSDAQISFGARNGRWSVAAFVHNVENDRFQVFANVGVQTNVLVADNAAPRTFGVRLSTRY